MLLAHGVVSAAPDAVLWERWTRHDPTSIASVDHRPWDRFLATYRTVGPDRIARIAYRHVTTEDRAALGHYIRTLGRTDVDRLSRDAQFAFWVNLYNAMTVDLVLAHYPVGSIRDIDISPGWLSDGPWRKTLLTVAGEALSLDDIEHRILRPIWRDPRVHYVVNCASLGCPDIPPVALTASNQEAMLDRAARAFVTHPRGATVREGRLTVSSLYRWFADDFGGSDAAIISHIARHAGPSSRRVLTGITRIAGYDYDWTLNDSPTLPGVPGRAS